MIGWTEEAEALAHRLYIVDGRSAAEVARMVGHGKTRNAIIGIAHRRGWVKEARLPASAPGHGAPKATRRLFDWTADLDAHLTRLAGKGVTKAYAAKVMGIPSPTLQRRVASLNLTWVQPDTATRDILAENQNGQHSLASPDEQRARAKRLGSLAIDVFAAPANDDAIPLVERRFGQCAWPVGEPDRPCGQLVCGQRSAANSSYCDRHRRIGTTGQVVSAQELTRALRRFA